MSKIYIVHYGLGGELDRRLVPENGHLEQTLSAMVAELAAENVLDIGDTIKIEEK